MACWNTPPYICTYDSNLGAGKDYSGLNTWEAASDVDISGYGILSLECYDSQIHSDKITMDGATGLDKTHYRVVRSAADCTTPFAGKAGTGANFVSTTAAHALLLVESYSRIENLCIRLNVNSVSSYAHVSLYGDRTKAINIVAFDGTNAGTGAANGIMMRSHENLAYNCIVYNCKGFGFQIQDGTSEIMACVCCTAVGNGADGFANTNGAGTCIFFSCYGANNSRGDFDEIDNDAPSGWNASKDNTSDLSGTAGDNYKNGIDLTDTELDADYLAITTIKFFGGVGDNAGRNPYDDLVAVSDFDDFFKNDTAGEAISKLDIRGNPRPTPDTADVSWDVGASEYIAIVTTLPPTSLPPTSLPPTSLPPTSLPPTSLPPTSLPPTSLPPTSLAPTSLAPTSLPPTSLPPTSLPPTSLAPTSLPPTSLPPTSLAPTTVAITTLPPTTPSPTTLPPTTIPPTTLPPTTFPHTTLPPTTVGPTTIGPTTSPLDAARAIFETSNANPPIVETARAAKAVGGNEFIEVTLTALVRPNHYYRLREDLPIVTVIRWIEYTVALT